MFLVRSVVDFRFVHIDGMSTAVDFQCKRVNAKVKIWLYPCSSRKATIPYFWKTKVHAENWRILTNKEIYAMVKKPTITEAIRLTLCRSNLKPYCMGRKAAFFQQAFKFTYYARNRSPLQEKKS